jgi:hypothetical protein
MDTVQERLEQIERIMKNILELQAPQGTEAGSSREQGVSNAIDMASNPPLEESSPALPVNTADGTADSAPILSFSSHLYQKLPHPFSSLLKDLPVVDGKDVNSLCDFLLQSLRMVQVGQVGVPTIYEILYPFCKGEVLVLLVQALSARDSFDTFHERLLKRFIPARQLSQLWVE